jgi:hypothetical protein
MKIEEKVPTTIPITSASENPFEPVHAAQYRLDGPGANPEMAERTLLNLARNRRKECFNKSLNPG